MAAVIFPWPTRAERRVQVDAARRAAAIEQAKAAEARQTREDLRKIFRRNHIGDIIAEGLAHGQSRTRRDSQ